MAGRPRLPIGTFGSIKTVEVGARRFRAWTRFRDWDGQTRQVTATGSSRNASVTALKVGLAERYLKMQGGEVVHTREALPHDLELSCPVKQKARCANFIKISHFPGDFFRHNKLVAYVFASATFRGSPILEW